MHPLSPTLVFDFKAPPPGTEQYQIYGGVIPINQIGIWLLLAAAIPAAIACLLRYRGSDRVRESATLTAALLAFLGSYILSTRWLDDLFVNLIHPYNLYHYGLFSASASEMVNGTVEIIYYFLLTPFAGSRTELIRADFVLGALVGAAHLLVLWRLLRRYDPFARLIGLLFFSIAFPVIQTFSSGYGNGLVSLAWFVGVDALLHNNTRRLTLCCVLLPLLRPEALLYSFSLILMDSLIRKRILLMALGCAVIALVAYMGLIKLMYGQWLPTPVVFKHVSLADSLAALGLMGPDLTGYFFSLPFRAIEGCLIICFFFLKPPTQSPFTRRQAAAWLVAVTPLLLFFKLSGHYGYNPTNFRYYEGFELTWTVIAILGLMTLVEKVKQAISEKVLVAAENPGDRDRKKGRVISLQPAGPAEKLTVTAVSAVALLLLTVVYAGFGHTDDTLLGIETSGVDLQQRMQLLAFAGRYCDHILPEGWSIASTEMNTFGFCSGRPILDLWGFTNMQIANSPLRTADGLRYNPHVFLDSNVPVFWLRTIEISDSSSPVSFVKARDSKDLAVAFVVFPNLSRRYNQAGDLLQVFQKYDVMRIWHGDKWVTILLVRKDLSQELYNRVINSGLSLDSKQTLDMETLKSTYVH